MGTMYNPDDYFKDAVGNPIFDGDLLRMKHFRTNRKRYYMYKVAVGYGTHKGMKYLAFRDVHTQPGGGGFNVREDKQGHLKEMVVVSRAKFYNRRELDELKRSKEIRD